MYEVAKGHAFISKRGALNEGDKILEKDFSSKENFEKAIASGKVIKNDSKQEQLNETAQAVVDAAKEMLAYAKELSAVCNAACIEAEAKITPVLKTLLEKEKENKEIAAARKTLTDAENNLAIMKKPEDKSAAEDEVNKARIILLEKQSTVPEIKALADKLATVEMALIKAQSDKAAAEEAVADAKKELKTLRGC